MNRRLFIKKASLAAAAAAASSGFKPLSKRSTFPAPYLKNPKISNKVMVLGLDGMDPDFTTLMMKEGELPTFKKLIERGQFGPLQTTMPPQSPVAWASFITGTNPGGHGIFDFVHRDPKTFTPYLSTSRSFAAGRNIDLGGWSIPVGSGHVDLMRKGKAFWSFLEAESIPCSVLQIPSNFPVTTKEVRAVSGMGTPDLRGGYGIYSYYSEIPVPGSEHFTSGRVVRVHLADHAVKTTILGPANTLRADQAPTEIEIEFRRDPREKVVRVIAQGTEKILKQGEWSDWIPLQFTLAPVIASVSGIVRIYVKEVHPYLKIYVSPVQIDPMDPAMPICSPKGYSRELAESVGRFYTQGLPADTKSLSEGVLSNAEYFEQAKIVLEESFRIFDYELSKFHEGFFFYYFSSIDQNSHMLWRLMDPTHPLYEPNESKELKGAIRYIYRRMDDVLKRALSKVDNYTTLIILSDHGFATFEREFHLSRWLYENGFTAVTNPAKLADGQMYEYVDWDRTKAYALGINGIYLNLKGREKSGWVSEQEGEGIKQDIISKLHEVTDPKTGKRVVSRAFDSKRLYSGAHMELAPDILVGYERGFRISDEAVLGKFPMGIVGDRIDKWSADHCMDPARVPGTLITNKPWLRNDPAIWDLAPTILHAFGFDAPSEMNGAAILDV